ncbi:MAG TPA: phosphonate ABC transporter, permease protein PhnE [Terrimicrobiaceae bacterium]|mgnify:CR=1 FL=1|nr:phosphonate ABC transporter, permease protein PhnE [Terrimicrobiaceae bacterium]
MNPDAGQRLPWHQRLNLTTVSLLVFAVAVGASLPALRGSGRELDYGANALRFLHRFFPPDFSVTGRVLEALGETLQIAVLATLFSIVLAFPIAVAGAQTLSPRWLVWCARMTMNAIRTIPGLIWALLAVAIVGPHPLAGVIGLTFYSVGYLGKFFSEAFESVDLDVARGLRAIGASRFQAFQHGLWPHARPLIWSYSLWMLEYNIRSASIVGYVGAGGVGVLLHVYQEYYQWDRFATVLLFILALVSFLDLAGEKIRRQLAPRTPGKPLGA